MNHIERVRQAIAHETPDRLPKGEFALEDGLVRKLLRLARRDVRLSDQAEAMNRLGLDLTAVSPKAPSVGPVGTSHTGQPVYKDIWGCEVMDGPTGAFPVKPALTGIADLKSYTLPDPGVFSLETIKWWKEKTSFFVFALINGGFSTAAALFGFAEFLIETRCHEADISGLVRDLTIFSGQVAERALAAGADGVIIADDLAYNQGTYLHPDSLRKMVLSPLADVVANLHRSGKPVFFHSDGNLNEVMADLVDTGIDGIHCLEPGAGMDLARIKQQYGQKICLMGNLDYKYLQPEYSPEQVREQVRAIIQAAAGGGGFILSSCTGILGDDAEPANVLAMYDEADRWAGEAVDCVD